eukprot:2233142-Prymnesium_polylepis.1
MDAVHGWGQELYDQWEVMASVAEEAGWTQGNRTDAEGYALTEPRDSPVCLARTLCSMIRCACERRLPRLRVGSCQSCAKRAQME